MKNLKILGAIVLVTVLGVAGWFFTTKQSQNNTEVKNDKQQEEKQVVKQDKEEELNNQIKDKTEDQKIEELINSLPETSLEKLGYKKMNMSKWKTYRNEEFGFEVKYPQSWTFGEGHKALKPRGLSKEIVDVVFNAPGDTPGGGTWRILPREKSITSLEKIIQGFKEKNSTIKRLKIGNYDAIYSRHINQQQTPK